MLLEIFMRAKSYLNLVYFLHFLCISLGGEADSVDPLGGPGLNTQFGEFHCLSGAYLIFASLFLHLLEIFYNYAAGGTGDKCQVPVRLF